METVEDMKKYICQIVNKIYLDRNLIMNFLTTHDIPYSNNNNGIFINISLLSDEIIVQFYNLIPKNIDDPLNNDKYEEEYGLYLSELNKSKNKGINIPIEKEINYQPLELTDIQTKMLILN